MFFSPKIVRLLATVGFTLGFYFWDPPWLTNLARKINLWPSFFKDSTVKGLLCVALGVLLACGLYLVMVRLQGRRPRGGAPLDNDPPDGPKTGQGSDN